MGYCKNLPRTVCLREIVIKKEQTVSVKVAWKIPGVVGVMSGDGKILEGQGSQWGRNTIKSISIAAISSKRTDFCSVMIN